MNADKSRKKSPFYDLRISACICGLTLLLCGCGQSDSPAREVVLYTSIDQPYAAAIVKDFEAKSGITVVLVTDAEATKSVGLAERVRAEKDNPQADVFWSNEPFHTINLAAEGLLDPYRSPSAEDVPEQFKDPGGRWASNGLRARVIGVRPDGPKLSSLFDLRDPSMKGRIALAKPTAGTTGGHVAALYVLWGDEQARKFFTELRANEVKLLGGNSAVAQAVADGSIDAGLTDNDDVAAVSANGGKIEAVLPDQPAFGTLMVPTTIGLVTGAERPDAARQLIDYLLSADVERQMLDLKFVGWSVRDVGPGTVKPMEVDFREVARAMPRAVRDATAILEGRD